MKLSNRIRTRRIELKLTQSELAQKLGYKSRSSINKIELGISDITQSKVLEFAKVLDCSPEYLMGWEDATTSEENKKQADITPYNPIVHKIPVLGYISAGLPLYAEEHITDYTYTERNGGAEYFALKVKGDSMSAAQINDGNVIIVRKQDVVEDGEIAVIRVDDEDATVKRFKRVGDIVQLIPQSYNPEHEIQIYDLKNTDIQIIGKVVECKIEF